MNYYDARNVYMKQSAILAAVVVYCVQHGNPTAAYVYARISARYARHIDDRILTMMLEKSMAR